MPSTWKRFDAERNASDLRQPELAVTAKMLLLRSPHTEPMRTHGRICCVAAENDHLPVVRPHVNLTHPTLRWRAGLHRLVAKIALYEADTLTPCTQMNKPWEMRCVSERDSEVRDIVSRKVWIGGAGRLFSPPAN